MTFAQFRVGLDAITRAAIAAVLVIVRGRAGQLPSGAGRSGARDALADAITRVIWGYRTQAGELAQRFLREQAASAGVTDDVYTPSPPVYSRSAMRTVLADMDAEGGLDGSPSAVADRVAAVAARHTEGAARRVVVHAVEDLDVPDVESHAEAEEHWESDDYRPAVLSGWGGADTSRGNLAPIADAAKKTRPTSWARVLTGADNCAFCVMLASRGAVYSSASTARGDVERPDRLGDLGYRYHDNCDCIVVPVYGEKWDGADTAEALQQLYERAVASIRTDELRDTDRDIESPVQLRKLRRYLAEHPEAVEEIVGDLRLAA